MADETENYFLFETDFQVPFPGGLVQQAGGELVRRGDEDND
jgi:hypothetical protein